MKHFTQFYIQILLFLVEQLIKHSIQVPISNRRVCYEVLCLIFALSWVGVLFILLYWCYLQLLFLLIFTWCDEFCSIFFSYLEDDLSTLEHLCSLCQPPRRVGVDILFYCCRRRRPRRRRRRRHINY